MPYAIATDTAHHWATERAIALWVWFAGDLSSAALATLAEELGPVRTDGARFALVVPAGQSPRADEEAMADLIV